MNSNPESESRNLLFPNQIPIPSSKISIPISNIKILNSYSESQSQILKFRSRNPEFKFKIPNPNSNFGIGIRSDSLGLKSRRSTSGDHGQYCKSWVMLLRTNRAVSVWNLLRLGRFFLKFSEAGPFWTEIFSGRFNPGLRRFQIRLGCFQGWGNFL